VAKKEQEPLPIGRVPLLGCRCRCGHEWFPRFGEEPRVCPKCKSPNWDQPKRWTKKVPIEGD
jgi:predicted Zn-ribbon and HTH transcriptional regulator